MPLAELRHGGVNEPRFEGASLLRGASRGASPAADPPHAMRAAASADVSPDGTSPLGTEVSFAAAAAAAVAAAAAAADDAAAESWRPLEA